MFELTAYLIPPGVLAEPLADAKRPGAVIVAKRNRHEVNTACQALALSGVLQAGFADEMEAMEWARTARGRVAEAEVNQRVTVAGVSVSPGDYVLADASGVAIVPAADIERVLVAAEEFVAREAAMAKALLAGTPISQVMGANYEHMLKQDKP